MQKEWNEQSAEHAKTVTFKFVDSVGFFSLFPLFFAFSFGLAGAVSFSFVILDYLFDRVSPYARARVRRAVPFFSIAQRVRLLSLILRMTEHFIFISCFDIAVLASLARWLGRWVAHCARVLIRLSCIYNQNEME